ncbi:MAG: hypothetical protein C4K60_16915 [Ideonella sp. MAG2]|nr:MAG: hypothetical protein C4K60_16915 [Ideonella sp. MAG2]
MGVGHKLAGLGLASLLGLLGGCASTGSAVTVTPNLSQHPARATCPTGLPEGTQCLSGKDEAGAFWWIAMPAQWSGVLVMHAHGGPELGTPNAERSAADLQRWSIMVRAGHAWAGSTFRQGGVAVRAAAEDTERLRLLFNKEVAAPRRTVLHGQSWGAGVAAIGAEIYPKNVDGVLLTSGVLAGGTRSYDFRLDLRVVYQAVCGTHPKPDEAQYPVWMGLPPDSKLTRADLAQRVNDCTGVNLAADKRTPAQQQALDTLTRQARIPERSLIGHLNWATWHFQDIVQKRTGGKNPFGNIGVVYTAATGQDTLNAKVPRYAADPQAVATLAADTDPQGKISKPVLSLRGIHDATAFVEMDSVFADAMRQAGNAQWLVQTYSDSAEHSYLHDAEYPAAMDALLAWIDRGEKPTPQGLLQRCKAVQPRFGGECKLVPEYRAAGLETRVAPRLR